MVDQPYMTNRKYYANRPQGLMFANEQGTISDTGTYVPNGDDFKDFIILTDDNRGEVGMSVERIETRERMVNGRMRSYHTADKRKISVEWKMVPSRAFNAPGYSAIDPATGLPNVSYPVGEDGLQLIDFYTTDHGAAGSDMLSWYNEFTGSFWVFLSYDNPYRFPKINDVGENYSPFFHLPEYSERYEMFFSNFDYTVVKRGNLFDYWNVKLTLEEA